jgi:hypothetical protein
MPALVWLYLAAFVYYRTSATFVALAEAPESVSDDRKPVPSGRSSIISCVIWLRFACWSAKVTIVVSVSTASSGASVSRGTLSHSQLWSG